MYLVYFVSHSPQDIIIISWKASYPPSHRQNLGGVVRADSTVSQIIYFTLLLVSNSQENSRFPASVLSSFPTWTFLPFHQTAISQESLF